MGSNDKAVQMAQKEKAELELKSRLELLTTKKVGEEKTAKDTVVRHLRADIKKLNKRIETIDNLEKLKKEKADKKAKKAAAPKKKDKKKGKKQAEPQKKQGGGNKSKKKKK